MADPRIAAWRAWLDRDRQVRRWYETMAIASGGTAEERLRVLVRFCNAVGTTPPELVERMRSDGDGVEDLLQDFVNLLQRAHKPSAHGEDDANPAATKRCRGGHSPGYALNFVKSVRGWLRHNRIALVRKIVIGDAGATPTVEAERVPTPEQLRQVLKGAGLRGRAIISFCAFAGLRPEVLGRKDATDGLRLEDLPDLRLKDGGFKITTTPMRVVVRRELSKVRKKYFTFLGGPGPEFLRGYLDHRRSRGEVLTTKSPVVRPRDGYERMGRPEAMHDSPFLGRQGISREMREAFRACGLPQRPYVLRSYFVSALASAEREGKITQLDREFFEGRKGAISAVYSVNKELAPKTIEEMREAFRRATPYLTSSADRDGIPADEFQERVNAAVANALGLRPVVAEQLETKEGALALLAISADNNKITVEEFSRALRRLRAPPKGATS